MGKKKTFSIRLRPEIMKKLRILGVEKERPLTDLLEEAVIDLLKKYGSDTKRSVARKG